MAFAADHRRSVAALLAFAISSVLFWFGNDLHPLWPLLWFAPLPILLFAARGTWWGAALASALSLFVGSFSMWPYLHKVLSAPFWMWAVIYSIVALVFMLAVLLFRALLVRGFWWSALLAFPALWVSCEYVHNLTTADGTAGSLAYSQLNFLPFLQLASITGPWGMSFLLLLFPAALTIGIHLRHTAPREGLRIVGASLGVIVLVLIFGAVRLSQPRPHQQIKVGLVAPDEPTDLNVAAEGADTERLFRGYAGEAEKLAARGAEIVVLPEKLGVAAGANPNQADAIFQSVADRTGSTIVVGMVHISPEAKYNQARVYTRRAPVLSYNKHHLLPPFESMFTPGTRLTSFRKSFANCGVAICKDMDFTEPSRCYGRAGAGIMLVPAWDFGMDRWWYGHIAVMRGVESGFSIARAAKNGYLTVSDDRGRILAQTRSDFAPTPKPFVTLLAEVQAVHNPTVYLLLGDWFAWLALAILLFALAQLYRSRHAPQREFVNHGNRESASELMREP